MNKINLRRSIVGIGLGALTGVALVAVPTPAHAVVTDGQVGSQSYSWENSDACTGGGGDEQDTVPWTDNGVTVTKSTSATATHSGEEGDVVDVAMSNTTSITSTPLGTGPATITGTATATASAISTGVSTACDVSVHSAGQAIGVFTLTQPVWATVSIRGRGNGQGVVALAGGSEMSPIFWEGGAGIYVSTGKNGTAVSSTLLEPGTYQVGLASLVSVRAQGAIEGSATYTGNFVIDMQPVGSASPVKGKGASKVDFGARDCANGDVPVKLSKKTVKKVKRVAFRVNGTKGTVLKGKKLSGKKPEAKTVVVPSSVTGVTKVKVKIKLKNGRRMQATRTYLPCR